MKTAIVYYSRHHGNTKKLLDAIAQENDVTLFDVTKNPPDDLSAYDRIGFASGIYYSGFQKSLLEYAQAHMPQNKQTFFIYTTPAAQVLAASAIRMPSLRQSESIMPQFSGPSAAAVSTPSARSDWSAEFPKDIRMNAN